LFFYLSKMFSTVLLLSSLALSTARLQGWTDSLPLPKSAEEAAARRRQMQDMAIIKPEGPFTDGYAIFTADFGGEGFMRTIRPIGVCYQTSRNGTESSEIATHLMILPRVWTIMLLIFENENCTGSEHDVVKVSMDNDGVYLPEHVDDLESALQLPEWAAGGFLWTSYMTENGCVGNPSSWELGVTTCSVADEMGEYKFSAMCNATGYIYLLCRKYDINIKL
jgi:hypothetical protein